MHRPSPMATQCHAPELWVRLSRGGGGLGRLHPPFYKGAGEKMGRPLRRWAFLATCPQDADCSPLHVMALACLVSLAKPENREVSPVMGGWEWGFRDADCCPATFCPSLRHVALMQPHRHGCQGLDDALLCCLCSSPVRANNALVRLSEQQEMSLPSFSVLLPRFR